MEIIDVRGARRLALCRAGLLKPEWTGLASRARGRGPSARAAVQAIIERFGYLQLDTVSIAGARSHALVLLSRLEGLDASLAEELLQPGCQLFEYWGHEASWLPLELYAAFEFRRREFAKHPWWGDVVAENPALTERLRAQLRDQGPLRSVDMEGQGSSGWWDLKAAKRVATALWSSGEWAIRERKNFQRTYDLAENVLPAQVLAQSMDEDAALGKLLLRALDGHGWASTGSLAATWRLVRRAEQLRSCLHSLVDAGEVVPCALATSSGPKPGWIRPRDIELTARLESLRPRAERGVLLSPFDPVLWDRGRVQQLFGFVQLLEIFKPAAQRVYGYYCLPVLAGEHLVARFDLKADRPAGCLHVLSCRFERGGPQPENARDERAAHSALERYAKALGLRVAGPAELRRKS